MKDGLRIESVDIPFFLRCKDKRFIADLKQRYRHFLGCREKRKAVRINIRIIDKLPDEAAITSTPKTIRLANHQLRGTFNPAERIAHLQLLNRNPVESLDIFLRNLYTVLLLNEQGLVLHAAGIVRKRGAYIFFGTSGSGKTTVARFSSRYSILSDDQVFIKQINGSFRACPVRDGKVFNGAGPFSIAGLFYLVKDKKVFLRKMPISQALAKIITIPNLPQELIPFEELLNRFAQLLEAIPCFELHFLPDGSFWRCIDGYFKSASG